MKNLPIALIYSRVIIGLIIPVLAYLGQDYAKLIAALMIFGLLTDVFDGIVARKLGVSNERLRVLDSNVDQFFWLSVIASVFYMRWDSVEDILILTLLLLLLEALIYVLSYLKFKRTIATHSLLAKFWTLSMLFFLVELCVYGTTKSFYFCFILGLVSRMEILAIIIGLKAWASDVPSLWAVGKINRGEPVKKSKLFNS